jgi:hypothetical protein
MPLQGLSAQSVNFSALEPGVVLHSSSHFGASGVFEQSPVKFYGTLYQTAPGRRVGGASAFLARRCFTPGDNGSVPGRWTLSPAF